MLWEETARYIPPHPTRPGRSFSTGGCIAGIEDCPAEGAEAVQTAPAGFSVYDGSDRCHELCSSVEGDVLQRHERRVGSLVVSLARCPPDPGQVQASMLTDLNEVTFEIIDLVMDEAATRSGTPTHAEVPH
jgi:hypothetical protein